MSGPDIWGPHGWKFIHYITLGYPPNPTTETKKHYSNFFHELKFVIPCSICGNNFKKHIHEYPLTDEILSNKKQFIDWGITMHNLVNLSNNKKIYDYNDGLKEIIANCTGDCPGYTNTSIDEPENVNKYILYNKILLFICACLIIFIIYKHINK